ncbi:MAG TPA: pilus assembly protein PilM [Kofleriaceae bacterium]|nr:pilus assembly protein PilM [Kofleriaceae bacterium]
MATRMFAVDLGAWSVKLAIASPGIRGAALLDVREKMVPAGDEPTEQRMLAGLKALIDELHLREDPGYIGVYGDQVFTQILEFGFKNLRRAELDKAVGGELEGELPVELDDMVYTFEQMPALPATGPVPAETHGRVALPADGMRVLTYAMRKDRAEHIIGIGQQSGFQPRGLLACGGAATKLVAHVPSLMKARTDGAVAVIDIGHERTDVVVVYQNKAVFSRSIPRAGKQVTEAIARNWKLPFDRAEQAKHADGFVASNQEPPQSDAWAKISNVLIQELAPFARDLRQTIAACRAKTGFTPLGAILVGGGARLRGIGSFLSEQLAIPAWRLTRDDAVALAGPRIDPNVATQLPIDTGAMTVGMAYDAAGGRPQFDLQSGALAAKMDLSFLRAKAVQLGVAALAMAAFAAFSAYADLYRLRKSEKALTTRLANESTEVFGAPRTASEVLSSSGANGSSQASPLPKMSAWDVMLEVSAHVPPKDKITLDIDKLDIDENKVDITGIAKTPKEIDDFVVELKKIECFKEPQRGQTDTTEQGTKFRITIPSTCMKVNP